MMFRTLCVYILWIAITLTTQVGFASDYALILGGVGGEKSFHDAFWSATSRMYQLLTEEYGYSPENITFLFEDEGQMPGWVDGKATKATVEAAFAEMAQTVTPTDRFVLFMVGHATQAGSGLKFNLSGPDLDETAYADSINRIPAEQMILIFGFPYSGRMVPQVSQAGRTIITSSSPREGYMRSGFGNIFIDAFSDTAADADGDGAISLLEAFLYTQEQLVKWYENDGSVQSEHPHLDDNGDGVPSSKKLPDDFDKASPTQSKDTEGLLAQQTFLGKRHSPLLATMTPPTSDVFPESGETTTESVVEPIASPPFRESSTSSSLNSSLPYHFISETEEQQIEVLIADAPDANAYPDADAVVLWEAEALDINEDNRYVYSTRRVVKVFNEKGRTFGEVSIPYTRGNDDITIHHARTITPDASIVELDSRKIIKDIPPPSAVQAGLFVDARLMHFTMPEMSDGCIIDYAYSSNNQGHLMRGEFWRQVYFQTSVPVQHYRFTAHVPQKKVLYYHIHGPHIEPTIVETNYTRTYTFEVDDVPPLREEAFMPAIEDLAYNISISSLESWDKLAAWYATLIREQDYITPEIEQQTRALLTGAQSRQEKIKRIYEYVATNIDYIGIELGIWAIKPHAAPLVFKEGYGDCKDKATLLSAMLSAAGIQSYPVLISAGESGQVVREIPSLAYFNHMLLAVEEDDEGNILWLDPTVETCAFGDLPASDQDRWTLILNPDFLTEGKTHTVPVPVDTAPTMRDRFYQFAKSPTIPADGNLKRVVTQLQVESDLSVKSTQEITLTGEFNTKLRSQLKSISPDEQALFLHQYMELDERAKLDQFEIAGLDTLGNELKISLSWHCADYLFAMGRQFVLELPIVKHPYAALLSEERRTHPVVLGKALTVEDEIRVELAHPFAVDAVPETIEVGNDVGEIQLKYTTSEQKIVMKGAIRFQSPTVDVNQLAALTALVKLASNPGTKRVMLVSN